MKISLNVLPYALRRRQMVRLRLYQWCFVWAAAATAASNVVYWAAYVPYQACLAERLFQPNNANNCQFDVWALARGTELHRR